MTPEHFGSGEDLFLRSNFAGYSSKALGKHAPLITLGPSMIGPVHTPVAKLEQMAALFNVAVLGQQMKPQNDPQLRNAHEDIPVN